MARDIPAILPATDRMEARLEALATKGVDVDSLDSRPATAARRWNITTASSFPFMGTTRTCRPSRPAGVTTR